MSPESKPKVIAMIVGAAIVMQQFDATVITTALPQMAISLHTDPVRLSVAVTAYLLSLAVFVPVSGWAADRYGGRTIFRAAIALFTLGSICCGFSQNVAELTAARVLQGLGGAMMVPVGRLVLFRSVEKATLIATMAYLQVPAQFGPVLGPPIGGFITTYFSWRWIFWVNVPLGLIGIALVTMFFDNPKEDTDRPLDWIGFVLTGASLFCFMYGIEAIGRGRAEFSLVIVLLVVGCALGALALRHLLRTQHPLLDLSIFRVATFRVSVTGGSLFRAGAGTLVFLLPLLLQVVFGMSAFASGTITFATALGSMSMKIDGTVCAAAFRVSHCDDRRYHHQRGDDLHVRVPERVDAGRPDFRIPADRRVLPVAAIHRDAGDDLCRRGATANEHRDQHRRHDPAVKPRLRHFGRRRDPQSLDGLARCRASRHAGFHDRVRLSGRDGALVHPVRLAPAARRGVRGQRASAEDRRLRVRTTRASVAI